MRQHLACGMCAALLCYAITAHAQQGAGPGGVVRPRTAEAPEGVKLVGCVLPEIRPNSFRLVLAPEGKAATAAKLPKGLKAGSSLELVAANDRLRVDVASQQRVIDTLRETANALLRQSGGQTIGDGGMDDARLSALMLLLV